MLLDVLEKLALPFLFFSFIFVLLFIFIFCNLTLGFWSRTNMKHDGKKERMCSLPTLVLPNTGSRSNGCTELWLHCSTQSVFLGTMLIMGWSQGQEKLCVNKWLISTACCISIRQKCSRFQGGSLFDLWPFWNSNKIKSSLKFLNCRAKMSSDTTSNRLTLHLRSRKWIVLVLLFQS